MMLALSLVCLSSVAGAETPLRTVTSVDPHGATSAVFRVEVPIANIDEMWTPDLAQPLQGRKWWITKRSAPQSNFPYVSFFDTAGRNAFSLGSSSLDYDNELVSKINQEKGVFELTLTVVSDAGPLPPFAVTLDRRPIDWTVALADWRDGLKRSKGPYPDGAWKPVYCSWYAAHAAITQDWVERQASVAARLGFKTFILDDGWSYDEMKRVNPQTIKTWYRDVGRWDAFSKAKFPDFKAHRERMRAFGLKYLVWVAPYFVGTRSPLYEAGGFAAKGEVPFEGNVLADVADTAFMDKVDDQLVRLLGESDLDGLKIDFLDYVKPSLERPRGAASRAYIDRLMKKLKAVRPDGLYEFRQSYATPATAAWGTQFRAGDVPFEWLANLLGIAQIRLAMGDGVPIHADPIFWSKYETTDNIHRHFMASMAGVPMLSMDLEKLSAEERGIAAHWLEFYRTKVERFQREGRWRVRYRNGSLAALWAICGDDALLFVNDAGVLPEAETALKGKRVTVLNLTRGRIRCFGIGCEPAAAADADRPKPAGD